MMEEETNAEDSCHTMKHLTFSEDKGPVGKISSLRQRLKLVDPLLMLLVIVFASSAWIGPLAALVELPVMVHTLPEGWALPSYVTVIVQCSVIAPLVYALVNKLYPGDMYKREVILSFIIMGVTFTGLVTLAGSWYKTVWIAGSQRSLALFLLVLYLSAVSNLSTVVYIPYMATFKDYYMSGFTAGEDMGGLITGAIGLIQGGGVQHNCHKTNNESFRNFNVSEISKDEHILSEYTTSNFTQDSDIIWNEPRFSVTTFFIIIAIFSVLSVVSFSLMNFTKRCRKEMVANVNTTATATEDNEHGSVEQTIKNNIYNTHRKPRTDAVISLLENDSKVKDNELKTNIDNILTSRNEQRTDEITSDNDTEINSTEHAQSEAMIGSTGKEKNDNKKIPTVRKVICFCCINVLSFIMYGVHPSVQSYSTLPYSPLAYSLAVCLNAVINPVICLSTLFIRTRSLYVIVPLVSVNACLFGFHVFLASMSPEPPLHGTVHGALIAVVTNVLMGILLSFTRASIANILCTEGGHDDLFTSGVCYQAGALVGSVTGFIMVSVLHLFEENASAFQCDVKN